ncbi:hypothetical protein DITRI_Ditri01bG0180000 [Diplodiscus trichospermus]
MSALFHDHVFLIILISILSILAAVQAQVNVSVGNFLYANDENKSWKSPSGDFSFGFHPIPGEKDQFLLAIWYANIPERTIVWYANRKKPVTDKESKVELTMTGQLVLKDPQGQELWRSERITNDSQVSHAAMLDTGNFVIASRKSGNIWESFKYPTDTILPGQELNVDGNLLSALTETSYNEGKYQLRFNKGFLILNQIDMFTRKPYNGYFSFGNKSDRLIFNKSAYINLQNSNDSMQTLAPQNAVPNAESNYYRATLNFNGVFTLYSYPRNSMGGERWSDLWFGPSDICSLFVDSTNTLGTGPCGYNSICSPISGMPNCTCPPGFSFLDENNPYTGCKPDYTSYPEDCNPDGSTIQEDLFEFKSMSFVDFPFNDYGILKPATELECKQSCLLDCACTVAILQDPTQNRDGIGTCWKLKLPLSGGFFNRYSVDRTSLFKVLKSDASKRKPKTPYRADENRNQVISILSVLLGTSAVFNFLSLAAISFIFFCLYQRKLRHLTGVTSRSNLETNLRSFTYKDLERATKAFKEEIGRGAFGTVYKGELPSSSGNHVAVKKLENFVQEGEKEFTTEVKAIGQTHHKNLVRLLGYCDEAEHRLLVYEFMGNGSLSSFLFGLLRPSWQQRLQIASGIARGLTYLHEECSTQIIHCDIKPQNILLDDSFTAKISDFGLAKLLINNTRTLTGIRGTKGYVAPEWFRNTPVTVKVDVYSFGVMLLEIICCRRCVEVEMEEEAILTEWAYECYSEGMIEKLVEKDEEARSDVGKLEMLLKVAFWCVHENPLLRPSMRTVTMMLEGVVLVPAPPYPFLFDSMFLKT